MRYRSFEDLSRTVQGNLHRIPGDVDLVVGISRSGLLPANMIALALNLPFADIEGFVHGRILSRSHTSRPDLSDRLAGDFRRVLVIDDNVRSGESMRQAKRALAELPDQGRFLFCAVYGEADPHPDVDLVIEAVSAPHVFQWSIMHHSIVEKCCFDIDGVLCFDPTYQENDDGERYAEFLNVARPLFTPTHRLGHLVTSRLERYRPQTEAWLAAQGIEYGKLWMLDLPSAAARRKAGLHGRFKAEVFRALDAVLFIESEERQAIEIAKLSGKPVLSIETQRIVDPSRLGEGRGQSSRLRGDGGRLFRELRRFRRAAKRWLRC